MRRRITSRITNRISSNHSRCNPNNSSNNSGTVRWVKNPLPTPPSRRTRRNLHCRRVGLSILTPTRDNTTTFMPLMGRRRGIVPWRRRRPTRRRTIPSSRTTTARNLLPHPGSPNHQRRGQPIPRCMDPHKTTECLLKRPKETWTVPSPSLPGSDPRNRSLSSQGTRSLQVPLVRSTLIPDHGNCPETHHHRAAHRNKEETVPGRDPTAKKRDNCSSGGNHSNSLPVAGVYPSKRIHQNLHGAFQVPVEPKTPQRRLRPSSGVKRQSCRDLR